MYGLSLITDTLLQGVHFILHVDTHLTALAIQYGRWIYAILFLIVFCETGLVVTPFLPGDSLLFVAGALAASGYIDLSCIVALLCGAAILGDALNYWLGHALGQRLSQQGNVWWFRADYLQQTHLFYAQQGGKSLILARFVPILRTFAPFVAGVGRMTYWQFTLYNIIGALLWVFSFTYAGYYFGHLPLVKNNLHYLMGLIIILSVLPVLLKRWFYQRPSRVVDEH